MEQPTYRAASAPGRVNLIGEHLDYNGGLCLPIALPVRTLAVVRRAPEAAIVWESTPEAPEADPTEYVLGVLAVLGVSDPLHVDISSQVPIGSGLSSSAALECSVALAVDDLLGLGLSPDELVQACIRAETEYVGAPTGGLDQSASVLCRAGEALLLDFATGDRTALPFAPEQDGVDLLVVDTRASHAHTESGYGGRRKEAEAARDRLGVEHLAQADPAALGELPAELLRRARHVVSEQTRVRDFVDAARERQWRRCGELMSSSHASLRDDYEVSAPELDLVVEQALSAGALGARMTGGGFGGSAIVLVERARVGAVREAVDAAFSAAGWRAPGHHEGAASAGAHLESLSLTE